MKTLSRFRAKIHKWIRRYRPLAQKAPPPDLQGSKKPRLNRVKNFLTLSGLRYFECTKFKGGADSAMLHNLDSVGELA